MVRKVGQGLSAEEFDNAVLKETNRIHDSLVEAFSSEGIEFDIVRFIGLINGCQRFLSEITNDLYGLSEEEFIDLQVESVKVFAKYAGFKKIEVIKE